VLGYVGFGEYFYVAGVCRRWRGRYIYIYISFCHAEAPAAEKHKLRTLREAVVSTAARLQLALNNGAKLTELDKETFSASLAYTVTNSSLEPIAVLSLLRVYGYQWDSDLYAAAEADYLELIKWLHQVQCPIPAADKLAYTCCSHTLPTGVSILQWLHSVQPEWFNEALGQTPNKTWLLKVAGESSDLPVMQWLLRDLKARLPPIADVICNEDICTGVPAWRVGAALWALENGLQFELDCSKLDAEKHTNLYDKANAIVLWQWLHKESNRHRCTCSVEQV
jgi:hypothetical protein